MTVHSATNSTSALDIHRLLDEAFAGVEMTPELQDLKEEMRADLVIRVAELERGGLAAAAAARRAMAELGDVHAVVAEMNTVAATPPGTPERVRPKPAFVVRTVILALACAAELAVVALAAAGRSIPLVALSFAAAALAVQAGILVADSLRQETTNNYPLPRRRAAGYGTATGLTVAGLGAAARYLPDRDLAWIVGGGLATLAGIVVFAYLGASQTNRHKPWMVRWQAAQEEAGDRFTRDPAAAARFGLYTVTIWIITLAAFAGLTFAVGWNWSWLALIVGLVLFLVTLARMLFGPESTSPLSQARQGS